jgi:hypothetical protein
MGFIGTLSTQESLRKYVAKRTTGQDSLRSPRRNVVEWKWKWIPRGEKELKTTSTINTCHQELFVCHLK